MPPRSGQPQNISSVMEGSKDLGRFVVPYGNCITSPNELTASTIAAFRFCTALAEEYRNHELAEKLLHLADVHQAMGERFTRVGRRSMEARVEHREDILAWYLQRAVSINVGIRTCAMSDEERARWTETTKSVRGLLERIKERRKNDGSSKEVLGRGEPVEMVPYEGDAWYRAEPPRENLEDGEPSGEMQGLESEDDYERRAIVVKHATKTNLPRTGSMSVFEPTAQELPTW